MAAATKFKTEEKKVVLVDAIRLEMSESEAAIMLQVLNNVGGVPTGPRGEIDKIIRALKSAGVNPATHHTHGNSTTLYFEESL